VPDPGADAQFRKHPLAGPGREVTSFFVVVLDWRRAPSPAVRESLKAQPGQGQSKRLDLGSGHGLSCAGRDSSSSRVGVSGSTVVRGGSNGQPRT